MSGAGPSDTTTAVVPVAAGSGSEGTLKKSYYQRLSQEQRREYNQRRRRNQQRKKSQIKEGEVSVATGSEGTRKRSYYQRLSQEQRKEYNQRRRRNQHLKREAEGSKSDVGVLKATKRRRWCCYVEHQAPLEGDALEAALNFSCMQYAPESATELPEVPCCRHCDAKRFFGEVPSFCCADGQVLLRHNIERSPLHY